MPLTQRAVAQTAPKPQKHLTAAPALPRLDAKSAAGPPPSHDLPVNVAEK